MSNNWEKLVEKGWEKLEYTGGRKGWFYLSPPVNGVRKKVRQVSDLTEDQLNLAPILFPKSRKVFGNPNKHIKLAIETDTTCSVISRELSLNIVFILEIIQQAEPGYVKSRLV